jgi:hypothetical protein
MILKPRDVLDRCTIELAIGSGGMRQVYRAYDSPLEHGR